MATIMDNISEVANRMASDNAEAERIRAESVEAILKGMGHEAWEKYMSNFASGKQLDRLLGKDPDFLKPENYGHTILAYIAAAGPCTQYTGYMSMATNMPFHMAVRLDAGIEGTDTNAPHPGAQPAVAGSTE